MLSSSRGYVAVVIDKELQERFWSKVDTNGDCWEWKAFRRANYGRFWVPGLKLNVDAHRVSWMIVNGDISRGKNIMHKCDNPPCVRPTHLLLGTHRDNMKDMATKGRAPRMRGSLNGHSKLTDEQALIIRNTYTPGRGSIRGNRLELAQRFGISEKTVRRIAKGMAWQNL